MLPDRTQRLNNVGKIEDRLNASSQVQQDSAKLGDSHEFFVYIDRELAEIKTPDNGIFMSKDGTFIRPGENLTFQIPFGRVNFDRMAFHPLCDQPSTAVAPRPVFTPISPALDPALKMTIGIFGALGAVSRV